MRRGGCLLLVVGFTTGAGLVATYDWFAERFAPYLDRNEAIAFAAGEAKAICRDQPLEPGVDCDHYRLINILEMKEGWVVKLTSTDRRRVETQFIGRRGEYDDVATSNLLEKY